jgi:uncharacterized protein
MAAGTSGRHFFLKYSPMNRSQILAHDRLNLPASRLALRESKIHSLGCYATAPIKKGELVAEYTGPRLTVKAAEILYNNHHKTYLFGLSNGKEVIDGVGIAAFINHSCAPNCETDEVRGRIVIYALRDIAAGEEVTYDYCLYDGEPDDPARCFCRSKICRGSMYAEEELKRRSRRKKI